MSLLSRYDALAAASVIERDQAQLTALQPLDRLVKELARPAPFRAALGVMSLFRSKAPAKAPRGVYIWGHVGRGKTTLMDLFFESAPTPGKRRVHFHSFMQEVHDRLHRARREGDGGEDPVTRVAKDLAAEAKLLCFDEFSVTDIADAMILARLFSTLFSAGVVVVATSNVEPERLYEGGRNRDSFLPFIELLLERTEVVHLDARADFRMEKLSVEEVFFNVGDQKTRAAAEALFRSYMGADAMELHLLVKGRSVRVPQASGRSARFRFSEICGQSLGASDYLALCRNFDTMIVEDVPAMNFDRRDEARRFIILVDVLYDAKARLVLSAEADAQDLYTAAKGMEAQEFPRTVSRLIEMRSQQYLAEWQARHQ
jgi:cell division protein ZapE